MGKAIKRLSRMIKSSSSRLELSGASFEGTNFSLLRSHQLEDLVRQLCFEI